VLEITPREDGIALRSFAHVGRIEVGDLSITVRPKLAPGMLVELVHYAYSLRDFKTLGDAAFPLGDGGLQDLIIDRLRAEARALLSRGVPRRYVRRGDELGSPRGRIDVAQVARGRNPALTTLPCVHHPRSSDFLINRVLLSGLQLGKRLADSLSALTTMGPWFLRSIPSGVSIA
jgi:5-methylcytosine-specific restriction enzyme subunit McrC